MKEQIARGIAILVLAALVSGCALRGSIGDAPARVTIAPDGAIAVAGRTVSPETLGPVLRSLRVPRNAPIIIVANAQAPYRQVVPVLEALQVAGYARIAFAARD